MSRIFSPSVADISYESVRCWVLKFATAYARTIRRRRPRPDCRWHLDEVFVSIQGKKMSLWRAVDSEGEVLDILVQARRNKKAALKLMPKPRKKQGFVPSAVVADKLRSYGAAFRDLDLQARHETRQYANNRADNSHQPAGRRERMMPGFRSPGSAQRFLSIHSAVYNLFNTQRHLISRRTNRQFRDEATSGWRRVAIAA
jgi:putative transposase